MPEPDDQQQQGPAQLREARDRAIARVTELEGQVAERDALARENVMLRSGVDLDSPVGKLFAKGYDGELDAEAVKAAWNEVNGTPTPTPQGEQAPPPNNDGPTPEELEQQRLQGSLRTDATPPGGEPAPDPWDKAYGEFHSPRRGSQPRERRAAAALNHIIEAANAGDPRVVFAQPGEDVRVATQRWRESQMG